MGNVVPLPTSAAPGSPICNAHSSAVTTDGFGCGSCIVVVPAVVTVEVTGLIAAWRLVDSVVTVVGVEHVSAGGNMIEWDATVLASRTTVALVGEGVVVASSIGAVAGTCGTV